MLPTIVWLNMALGASLAAMGGAPPLLEFRWRGTVHPEALVDVQNSLGEVTAEITSGAELEVVAVCEHGMDEGAGLEVVQSGRGVAVKAVASLTAHVPRVHLRVKVPRGVRLRVISAKLES